MPRPIKNIEQDKEIYRLKSEGVKACDIVKQFNLKRPSEVNEAVKRVKRLNSNTVGALFNKLKNLDMFNDGTDCNNKNNNYQHYDSLISNINNNITKNLIANELISTYLDESVVSTIASCKTLECLLGDSCNDNNINILSINDRINISLLLSKINKDLSSIAKDKLNNVKMLQDIKIDIINNKKDNRKQEISPVVLEFLKKKFDI